MPSSKPCLIPDVVHYACVRDPKTILDVGVGFGKYGVLLREYLDIAHSRYEKDQWKVKIYGIDIFRPYNNPVWEYIYDSVTICNFREFLDTNVVGFDLIMLNDVIEHFIKKDALYILKKVKDHCKWCIITVPLGDSPQGEFLGNPFETHLSTWKEKEFNDIGFRTYALKENKGMFVL